MVVGTITLLDPHAKSRCLDKNWLSEGWRIVKSVLLLMLAVSESGSYLDICLKKKEATDVSENVKRRASLKKTTYQNQEKEYM